MSPTFTKEQYHAEFRLTTKTRLKKTRSHPEMVGDMSCVTLNTHIQTHTYKHTHTHTHF